MPVKIRGDQSGSVALKAPVSGGDVEIELPTALDAKLTTPGAWTGWTPTISAGGGAPVSAVAVGTYYQKIGRLVVVRGAVQINNKGTATGVIRVSLPFPHVSFGSIACGSGMLTNTANMISAWIDAGGSVVNMATPTFGTLWADGNVAHFTVVYEATS